MRLPDMTCKIRVLICHHFKIIFINMISCIFVNCIECSLDCDEGIECVPLPLSSAIEGDYDYFGGSD